MRYYLNPEPDPQADEKIADINQLYQTAQERAERGEAVVSTDEMTGVQALEAKHPDLPMCSGHVLQREFEYIRHGTVNLLVGLTTYNGRMWAECLDRNDGEHFRPAVCRWLHPYGWAKRIHLILDPGPSHTSGATTAFFEDVAPRVQVLWRSPRSCPTT